MWVRRLILGPFFVSTVSFVTCVSILIGYMMIPLASMAARTVVVTFSSVIARYDLPIPASTLSSFWRYCTASITFAIFCIRFMLFSPFALALLPTY